MNPQKNVGIPKVHRLLDVHSVDTMNPSHGSEAETRRDETRVQSSGDRFELGAADWLSRRRRDENSGQNRTKLGCCGYVVRRSGV
eukprot:3510015-Pleurochrysis_carterae.AAC.1